MFLPRFRLSPLLQPLPESSAHRAAVPVSEDTNRPFVALLFAFLPGYLASLSRFANGHYYAGQLQNFVSRFFSNCSFLCPLPWLRKKAETFFERIKKTNKNVFVNVHACTFALAAWISISSHAPTNENTRTYTNVTCLHNNQQ